MTARRRPTGNEMFHDSPSPAHPVRYRTANEPDRWLSVEDAERRLLRVLDIPPAERASYPIAKWLLEGRTVPSMFASYSIPKETSR